MAATALDREQAKAVRRALGTCLVVGGTGFLGSFVTHQLVELAKTAQDGVQEGTVRVSSMSVHVIDVLPPRPAFRETFKHVTFHLGSIADKGVMQRVMAAVDPDTVIHTASLIDLRPRPAANLDAVNVEATRHILELCRRRAAESGRVTKMVYTSTIEAAHRTNGEVVAADESMPYPRPTNGYMRTKIAAEKLVLAANETASPRRGLKTASVRPAHVWGQGDDTFFLGDVPVTFGAGALPSFTKKGLPTSMVNVENCAFAHVLAAAHLYPGAKQNAVAGHAFFAQDFDENIVCHYHDMCGTKPPVAQLPYWLLFIMVHVACFIAVVLHTVFCGYQLLQPKKGLHKGALAAGVTLTVVSHAARDVLGYRGFVTRADGIARCREWHHSPGTVVEKRVVPLLNPLQHLPLLVPAPAEQ